MKSTDLPKVKLEVWSLWRLFSPGSAKMAGAVAVRLLIVNSQLSGCLSKCIVSVTRVKLQQ